MITSFMDNLRKPKKLGRWAPTGEIRAGESDPYNWGKDLIERDRRDEMAGGDLIPMRRGNMGRVGARMSNPDWNDTTTNSGMRQMDVVYDQRPEMFQKQLNLEKDKMALGQKNLEAQRAINAIAANDDFIDNRRRFEQEVRQSERPNFTFRDVAGGNVIGLDPRTGKVLDTGVKTGLMSDEDKLKAAGAEKHAQITQQGLNNWIKAREDAQAKREVADKEAEARRDVANTQVQSRADLANSPENRMKDLQFRLAEMAIQRPEMAGALRYDDRGGVQIDPEADEGLRRQVAAYLYGDANVAKMNGMSSNVGGQPGSAGLRGNAPIDANATATPYAANSSNSAPIAGGGGQVMRKTQKNARTGATRVMISRDGGATWQPE